jgi:hypothetical protein
MLLQSFNAFTGVLPEAWQSLTVVTSLIVSTNKLESPFFDVLYSMEILETLDMYNVTHHTT